MANNKIIYGGRTLIDLTGDDVTPEHVDEGVTFHNAAGEQRVGTRQVVTAPVEEKDVNFYDYDGTLLYSYTLEEAQEMTELPPLPTHKGLICQGWNWDLVDIQALTRSMNIGAMYTTDDGKTRLHIEIRNENGATLPFYFWQTRADSVSIDWGDGSENETVTTAGYVSTTHTYAAAGRYTILLTVAEGCSMHFGNGDSRNAFGTTNSTGRMYGNMLRSVNIGERVEITGFRAFQHCYALTTVTIPKTLKGVGRYAFYFCCSLVFVVFPSEIETIGDFMFYYGTALKAISFPPDGIETLPGDAFCNVRSLGSCCIPDQVTSLGNSAFNSCWSLKELIIPKTVTSIAASALAELRGLAVLRFLPSTPPTVAQANAFTGLQPECVVEVPAEFLTEYQAATNYSGIAAQMVGV